MIFGQLARTCRRTETEKKQQTGLDGVYLGSVRMIIPEGGKCTTIVYTHITALIDCFFFYTDRRATKRQSVDSLL